MLSNPNYTLILHSKAGNKLCAVFTIAVNAAFDEVKSRQSVRFTLYSSHIFTEEDNLLPNPSDWLQ